MAEKQYIEREVAVEILKEKSLKMFNAYYKGYVNAIRDLIDIPSADVQEVRHGYWIDRGAEKGYFCSVCGSGCLLNLESDYHKSDFCPHCGARMGGEEE